jgi:5'-nucleotidase
VKTIFLSKFRGRVGLVGFFLSIVFLLFLVNSLIVRADHHDLVIYHTNDVHGYAFEARDTQGHLTNIGFDRLKTLVDSDETAHKLLLDAGDVLHGQPFATVQRGELVALILSLIGYDALAVGNHDFDYGQARLKYLVEKFRLNFIAANVIDSSRPHQERFFLPPYLIRTWGDLKVGIFGLSTPETYTSTDPGNVVGLTFKDPTAMAREMVRQLKDEGAEVIIAVTHLGSEPYCQPMSLTVAAEAPGIHLIIDGHSHSLLNKRITDHNGWETLVVSTGAYFQNLGRVYVDRKPEGGFKLEPEILSAAELEKLEPDMALHLAMAEFKARLSKELSQVVMTIPFALEGRRSQVRRQSTNMGRLISASLVAATGADFALINSGSIRESIPAGIVTKEQLLTALPYSNYIYVLKISGADLLAALNHGLGQLGSGAFPQFWGLNVEAEPITLTGADGSQWESLKALSVQVNGQPLAPKAYYKLATNDFLFSGGDGYYVFSKLEHHEFTTLEAAFKQFMLESEPARLQEISAAENLKIRPK